MKLLVVAAWEPELSRFREGTGPVADGVELATDTLGVGLVEAAIAMTQCIVRHRPTHALLLGTCGGFAQAIGTVVVAARARLVAGDLEAGTSALPDPMPAEVAFDAAIHDALVARGARSVQIANTIGITIDDELASRLGGSGDVEHLEAFAFARACEAARVPCGALLAVANIVGARGRAEWLANHQDASAKAGDAAWDALAVIAGIRTTTTTP